MNGIAQRDPRYGVPVTLSFAVHALLAIALAVMPFQLRHLPVQDTISVDLVQPLYSAFQEPTASPRPPSAQPVPKAASRPQAEPRAIVDPEPVLERMPSFVEIPRSTATSPPRLAVEDPVLSSTQTLPVAPSSAEVIVPEVPRPLPSVRASIRESVLHDPATQNAPARAGARPAETPRPEYPRMAREAGWDGTVILQVEVLPDGSVEGITLYKSSGHSVLDEAALKAVKTWRFVPAMDGNFPIRSAVRVPVKFDLRTS